MSATVLI